MNKAERKRRIDEIENDLSYKESQFWEDSPHHDMKFSALKRELKELQEEEDKESVVPYYWLKKCLKSLLGKSGDQHHLVYHHEGQKDVRPSTADQNSP